MLLPISDAIIAAIAKIVDDSKSDSYREPSHSDLDFCIKRIALTHADPKAQGQTVGKAKRVRAVLSWAIDNDAIAGSKLIDLLLSSVRASGGFRPTSPNFVGTEVIQNAIAAFDAEGYSLSLDGEIQAKVLGSLKGKELTRALEAYARRAQKGFEDAALLVGTGKDLLEATAAHVLQSMYGRYPEHANFPALLGQAYISLRLATPEEQSQTGEPAIKTFERAMFQTACAINRLRNKEGTGHGRPWNSSLSKADANAVIEMVGSISGYLLNKLNNR